jgi:hypothetical protein
MARWTRPARLFHFLASVERPEAHQPYAASVSRHQTHILKPEIMTRILSLIVAAAALSLASCAAMKKDCASCCSATAKEKACCTAAQAKGQKCATCDSAKKH